MPIGCQLQSSRSENVVAHAESKAGSVGARWHRLSSTSGWAGSLQRRVARLDAGCRVTQPHGRQFVVSTINHLAAIPCALAPAPVSSPTPRKCFPLLQVLALAAASVLPAVATRKSSAKKARRASSNPAFPASAPNCTFDEHESTTYGSSRIYYEDSSVIFAPAETGSRSIQKRTAGALN